MSLREKGKARRRSEVIASATSLWREKGLDAVSLTDIAAAAEVSIQTVYNLIGGVDALKLAIIEELLGRLELAISEASEQGVTRSILRARMSAQLFVEDPALYRPLLVSIPHAIFAGAKPSQDGASFQRDVLVEAQRLGEIFDEVEVDLLGCQIHLQFVGGLLAWASGLLDDAHFLRASELAVLGPLAACATQTVRSGLTQRARELLTARAQIPVEGPLS